MSQWQKVPDYDPSIADRFASGDVASRPMFTMLDYRFSFVLQWLSQADREIIEAHQEHVVVGSTRFTIRNKYTDEDWLVRLKKPISFTTEPADLRRFVAHIEIYGKQVEKMQTAYIDIEDLGAGVDIANRPVFVNAKAVTIDSVTILTQGAPAGVDDANTVVILLEDDASNEIVSKTYDTSPQPPSSDAEDLGTITNGSLAALEHVMLSVTQGATANMPPFKIAIDYYYTT